MKEDEGIFNSPNDEGSFGEEESIFGGAENHENPVITRDQEEKPEEPVDNSKWHLKARFGQNNSIQAVAFFKDGKQIEAWRHPTRSEFDMLRTQGQLVRLGDVDEEYEEEEESSSWGWWALAGVAAAAAGAGYYYYTKTKSQPRNNAKDDAEDEEDDIDDEEDDVEEL